MRIKAVKEMNKNNIRTYAEKKTGTVINVCYAPL